MTGGSLLLAYGEAQLLAGCFSAGCDDYLKEPWTPAELEWRLRKLQTRRPRRFSFSWGTFELHGLEILTSRGQCSLSHQEARVLSLLLRGGGEAVPREALYYAIWGKPPEGNSRVVDVHVSNLRRKLLRLYPQSAGCLRSVRRVGYLLS